MAFQLWAFSRCNLKLCRSLITLAVVRIGLMDFLTLAAVRFGVSITVLTASIFRVARCIVDEISRYLCSFDGMIKLLRASLLYDFRMSVNTDFAL